MKKVLSLVLVVMLLVSGCKGEGIIPAGDMVNIHYEMYLVESAIGIKPGYVPQSDSVQLYLPIIEKYGYSLEEYNNSFRYYLHDPEELVVILKKVQEKLKAYDQQLAALEDEKAAAIRSEIPESSSGLEKVLPAPDTAGVIKSEAPAVKKNIKSKKISRKDLQKMKKSK